MHILAATSGPIGDGSEPVDLGQSSGDIVLLSSADTELGALAAAWRRRAEPTAPSLRLANLLALRHSYSVDLYVEKTLRRARLVVVSLLGGRSYWPYGIERLSALARSGAFELAVLPGDDRPDASLGGLSTLPDEVLHRLWRYLRTGGPVNADRACTALAACVAGTPLPPPAEPFAEAGLYRTVVPAPAALAAQPSRRALVAFYRALLQAGDLAPIDALLEALAGRGLEASAVYVTSLRDGAAAATLAAQCAAHPPDVILNATAFAAGGATDGIASDGSLADASTFGSDAPVLQVILAGHTQANWEASGAGLAPRDISMHVALPEMDGRLLTRAIAFKADLGRCPVTELNLTRLVPLADRTDFVADLAANWCRLRATPAASRRAAIVLANYPNRDSRIANGVGLDTPASALQVIAALRRGGYALASTPATSGELVARLSAGPTNAGHAGRTIAERLALADYRTQYATLPSTLRAEVEARWGPPEADPFVRDDHFAIAAVRYGNLVVALQPARGYQIDPKATYHDPALVPPHGYLAFYMWLRQTFRADAVIHLGKHGNLEWLPGKALALSATCYPDAILGPVPNIYPFIVNDPGEGAQAKRRTAAVIVDHLMPPLVRAEAYGEHARLEGLIDEVSEAQSVDRRRADVVTRDILATAARLGLDADCGITEQDDEPARLTKLDAYLCELKELQIRGGLHVLGEAPAGRARAETLVALTRTPRGGDQPGDASLIRALATDLDLGDYDPLTAEPAEPWNGPRPQALASITSSWRTSGDTRERLEELALALLEGRAEPAPAWTHTRAVLDEITARVAPALEASAHRETAAILAALAGRFVAPGPSGAPSRGRLDTLPTGRNFYSVDPRAIPTPAAWELGAASAAQVVTRYVQDHGDWPAAMALTCWGTANMRTGGDDLAQAMALIGARPVWDHASRRVTGFEVMTLAELGRPRVDVTLRVSGFFRDAFPTQIALFDSAVTAISDLDEPAAENPIAARVSAETALLVARGMAAANARRSARYRVFSTPEGGYGAGLQAMMDERLWSGEADLAEAFLAWGHHAYGSDGRGVAQRERLETRLVSLDAILHNQDNREHDILDSDDYYQFAGGLSVAARALKGRAVPVLMGDHALPERPVVRTLEDEIARVVRARAANPKWIGAMRRHGYKGAFEIAATVDYLFAFAATTGAVRDAHFEALYEAYLGCDEVCDFLGEANPGALTDIAGRFAEAVDRGLWTPRSNSAYAHLQRLLEPRHLPTGPGRASIAPDVASGVVAGTAALDPHPQGGTP